MTNFTQNEIAALKMCLNYDNRAHQLDDNHSDASPVTIAKALGWNMNQAGGLISSLSGKGAIWVDDREGEPWHKDVSMHIVYLTNKGVDAIFDIIEAEKAAA
jgi:hypothetical protein